MTFEPRKYHDYDIYALAYDKNEKRLSVDLKGGHKGLYHTLQFSGVYTFRVNGYGRQNIIFDLDVFDTAGLKMGDWDRFVDDSLILRDAAEHASKNASLTGVYINTSTLMSALIIYDKRFIPVERCTQ